MEKFVLRRTPENLQEDIPETSGSCVLDWSDQIKTAVSGVDFHIYTKSCHQNWVDDTVLSALSLCSLVSILIPRQESKPAVHIYPTGWHISWSAESCKSSVS